MLFPYTYVPHSMEKMQEYIDFIFYEVWCEAPNLEYGSEIFGGLPELQQMLEDFWGHEELAGKPLAGGKFFLEGLNRIFNDFKQLEPPDIEQLKQWYDSNNDIEKCCCNDNATNPIRYDQINIQYPQLSKNLKSFFPNLYSHNFLSLQFVKNRIGELDDHYKKFAQTNKECICPFCSIFPLDGEWDPTRDAYDHYLPKSKYPFNSINFKNLVPTCDKCNSKNKGVKDPVYKDEGQRKAFYPFQTNPYSIKLRFELNPQDWTNLTPHDLSLITGPDELREEIDTWLEVYNIENRYKAKCCRKNDGEYWLNQALIECKNHGKTPDELFAELERETQSWPYAADNFLKTSFLEACQRSGLFDII